MCTWRYGNYLRGPCKSINNKFICDCPAEWGGSTCNEHSCTGYTRCKNSLDFLIKDGSCYINPNDKLQKCNCTQGWGGNTCEDESCKGYENMYNGSLIYVI